MGLLRTVPPVKDPVSLDEARKQVEIVGGDHDAHLRQLIRAATFVAEQTTGRAFITQTWQLTLAKFPPCAIPIPRPPLASVTSIVYVDTLGASQTVDSADYQVDATQSPGIVIPAYGQVWPTARNQPAAVTVTYAAGYGANPAEVPDNARQAVLILVAEWFANREANAGGMRPIPNSAAWLLDSLAVGAAAGHYRLT